MKIRKIYESVELDTAEKISEMFFENCGNFGSEDLIIRKQKQSVEMIFYFPVIDSDEFNQIYKCKNYLDYMEFFINYINRNLLLHIILTLDQQKVLDEKLDLDRARSKFNI